MWWCRCTVPGTNLEIPNALLGLSGRLNSTGAVKNEKAYLNDILQEGCKKANEIASQKIKKIHEIVGF